MIKSFFLSKKWAAWAYLGLFLLLSFLYIQTSLNVAINEWYKDFYDVLQKPKIQSKAEQKALLKVDSSEKGIDGSNLAESNSQGSVNLGENSSSNSSQNLSVNSSKNAENSLNFSKIHGENSSTNLAKNSNSNSSINSAKKSQNSNANLSEIHSENSSVNLAENADEIQGRNSALNSKDGENSSKIQGKNSSVNSAKNLSSNSSVNLAEKSQNSSKIQGKNSNSANAKIASKNSAQTPPPNPLPQGDGAFSQVSENSATNSSSNSKPNLTANSQNSSKNSSENSSKIHGENSSTNLAKNSSSNSSKNAENSPNLSSNSKANSSENSSVNLAENADEIPSTNSPQIQAQKQFPKNSAQILSQNELENALKSLNLAILSDDNKSLNFALIYAKFKENNETLIKNAENLGLNFAKIKESTKKQAAAQKAQNQLENANFLNKFSLFFYQNLLEIFFDTRSISGEDAYAIDVFYELIWVFLCIALPYVLIATINVYFASIYALKWREAMTFEYLRFWKAKDDNIEGSSQRIQEDIYNFSKIVESLGLAFVRAMMILFAFIPILWALSGVISKPLFEGISDDSVFAVLKHIDGLLVYVAFFISLGGLAISWIVGIKLPGLEYNNQKAEAAFRKELVFAEDDRRNYASRETMIELFTGLKFNYKRLFLHYGYFNIWLILFEQIIVIVPLLIVAPSLFAGAIGLGVVMQMNNAFDQVRSSFSVFITNWTKITELRSIHKRLKEFEMNIEYRKKRRG